MKTKLNALGRADKGDLVKIAAQLHLGKTAVKEWGKLLIPEGFYIQIASKYLKFSP